MKQPRTFPIHPKPGAPPHPMHIPWSVAERAYSVYAATYGAQQSLERLAERGGFGAGEMDQFLPTWREECSQIATLRAALQEAIDFIEALAAGNLQKGSIVIPVPSAWRRALRGSTTVTDYVLSPITEDVGPPEPGVSEGRRALGGA